MKRNVICLLTIAAACLYGCAGKSNVLPNTPVPVSGTFTGQFKLYHVNRTTNSSRVDSAYIGLVMETATGYKITGDTSKLHAGSHGSYLVDPSSSEILFADQTYPPGSSSPKVHLTGSYNYQYDGTTLQLVTYGAQDTLQYFYRLTRTGN